MPPVISKLVDTQEPGAMLTPTLLPQMKHHQLGIPNWPILLQILFPT